MKVIVPFTDLSAETFLATRRTDTIYKPLSRTDDSAYFNLYMRLWDKQESFVSVEQDIVPTNDQICELIECSELWCAFGYEYLRPGFFHYGLGCVKFAGTLMAMYSEAIRDTSKEYTTIHPRNHWCNLDDRISRSLMTKGIVVHRHVAPVGHLHMSPSHGCNVVI